MKLMIKEDDNRIPDKSKYILYTMNSVSEFDNYEDAVAAYKSFHGERFLYQPDKRYFFVTLSSTGYNYGKRNTIKAHGLFIAKNIAQIKKFLSSVSDWRITGGYASEYSKFRIYTGGYGSDPVCSDIDFRQFNYQVIRHFNNLYKYSSMLDASFGAVDVNSPQSNILRDIPFETF